MLVSLEHSPKFTISANTGTEHFRCGIPSQPTQGTISLEAAFHDSVGSVYNEDLLKIWTYMTLDIWSTTTIMIVHSFIYRKASLVSLSIFLGKDLYLKSWGTIVSKCSWAPQTASINQYKLLFYKSYFKKKREIITLRIGFRRIHQSCKFLSVFTY